MANMDVYVNKGKSDVQDKLKTAIAEDCKKDNKMTDKQLEKFAFVFDRIQEIILGGHD